MITTIESAQNDTYKKLLSLTTAKGLKDTRLFLLSGEKLIREFLRAPYLNIAFEVTHPALGPLALPSGAKSLCLSAGLFAQIDTLGTHFNILVLEQPEIKTLESLTGYTPKGVEIVIPIGDPGNLGALIRSCEAFAVSRAILTREAAHPFLPRAVKASAGSVLRLPILRGPMLSDFPESCIALDLDGMPLNEFAWPENGFLVIGEEGGFGRRQKFKHRIRIPTQGVESLNVVVAASIALAHKAALRV